MAQLDLAKGSVEEQIIVYAAMKLSPEDISERIGGALTPARVRLRVKELLQEGDWLEDAEAEKALLTIALRQIGDIQQIAGSKDLEAAKVLLTYLKDVLDRLEKRQSKLTTNLNTYNQNVGRQLGHVVDLALTYMKGALRESVDAEKWDELVLEAMTLAWTEIERHQELEA
ncbi:hypothetical protein [Microbacterium panaciterrae]|uniref:Uncharacterized protein n=1 Tax=Microbacterium panaciterrae TaxID=985759 RepID=A0ABP8P6Z6_9MICO